MSRRETAWRVLAQEFNGSLTEEKGVGDRAATYLVSPLGTRMNRVMIVGILSPAQPVGRDASPAFLRTTLTDPTGEITVTAGGFQPRALGQLRQVTEPTPALIVGKTHLFRGRDGQDSASVRAEALRPLGKEEYRSALAELADHSLMRFQRWNASPAADRGLSIGLPGNRGSTPLPSTSPTYLDGIKACLTAISLDEREPSAPSTTPAKVSPTLLSIRHLSPTPAPKVPSPSERAQESTVLELVDELAESTIDGYAELRELLQRSLTQGLSVENTETIVTRLEEAGVLEEPVVGKLRRS